MLGSAPGTDLLNEWVGAINDGMSLDDVANHIAASDAFQTTYPTFLTNREFAESFLENLMGSEDVPAALVTEAADIVVGLLNDGMTRGALALAVIRALYDIHDQGEAHAAYADLGMVANGLFNKIDVAEYYTVELRQTGSNSRVLRDVSSEMGLDEIRDSIGDHLDPPDPIYLTGSRDNIEGTVANDLIIAEPDDKGDDTLDPFDTIDGGGGTDTLEVYAGLDGITIDKNHADVMNVEHVYLSSRAAISADLTGWEGVETVELGRFGSGSDVSLTVAGADVSTSRTFGGAVTITGAAGEVDITADRASAVQVNSGAHTTSVSVKGGMSVNVNSAASASETVTSVSVDGVQRNNGADGARGDNADVKEVSVRDDNESLTPTAEMPQYVDAAGTAITNSSTGYYKAADQTAVNDGVTLSANQLLVTMERTMAEGYDEGGGDMPSVEIYSEAIESVHLRNNEAIVLVNNSSDDAEDLSVVVSGFGSHTRTAGPAKLCLNGDGAAENVSIMVAGDSDFQLAGDAITSVSVAGDGDLELMVTKFDAAMASEMESLTLSGSGDVEISVAGMGDLETVDASASSGKNTITAVGDSVESISGGSGTDIVHVMTHSSGGLAADLGDGNDVFISGAGNTKSRVNGGAGMDTLRLTSAEGQTHTPPGGRPTSNYSNFEVLDVGGSVEASYNAALIGVSSVIVSESTAATAGDDGTLGTEDDGNATVTLMGMGDGVGISVYGKGTGTTASIIHMMPEREPGTARYSGELDINLTANGGRTDTKSADGTTGEASLTIAVDAEIEILNINSSANAGGAGTTDPRNRPSAGHYDNTLTLDGDGTAANSTVEAINVSGNAQVEIVSMEAGLGVLELVNAEDNTGGVTISAIDSTEEVEMLGGSGVDRFTAGNAGSTIHGNGGNDVLVGGTGDDEIRGGTGGDTLTGSSGTNEFDYSSASDSQLAWTATGMMHGFDTITDWGGGTNTITLGPTMFNGLHRGSNLREVGAAEGVNSTDAATDNTANTLRAWLGDGEDVFKSTSGAGLSAEVSQHAITTVVETYQANDDDGDGDIDNDDTADTRTWVLIDVDADGNFDASVDMAIALTGTVNLADAGTDFTA